MSEVGSTHGTQGNDSSDDRDEMAVVVEHEPYVTGLRHWDSYVYRTAADGERSRAGDLDLTYYSLRKYVGLACQGNPSIIAALFAPPNKVIRQTAFGEELMALAPEIVSRLAIPRYRGYMRRQALRLLGVKGSKSRGARTGARPELVERYGYDTKFAMHMVRLGLQGCELANTGRLALPMRGQDGIICRAIRNGEWTADETLNYAFHLDERLAWLYEENPVLNGEPAWDEVHRYLHDTYLQVWKNLDDYRPFLP